MSEGHRGSPAVNEREESERPIGRGRRGARARAVGRCRRGGSQKSLAHEVIGREPTGDCRQVAHHELMRDDRRRRGGGRHPDCGERG